MTDLEVDPVLTAEHARRRTAEAAVLRVGLLHHKITRFEQIPDTNHLRHFHVCAECSRVESDGCDHALEYCEALWPCSTVRVLTHTLTGEPV